MDDEKKIKRQLLKELYLRKADETVNSEGIRELDILLDPTNAKNSQVPQY